MSRALAALTAFTLASGAAALAQTEAEIAAIWNDPVFKKQFIGGYGINADVEPRLGKDEVAILERVQPLMAKDLPAAEAMLKKAIRPESSAILDFTLGGIQFQQEKMAEALENHNKAVAKFPSFRRAWRNLGFIHVRAGDYDETIKAFTRMIELGGSDAGAFGLLGYAHFAKQDYQPAEAAFRNALLLQPDNTQWRLGLTQCVFKQHKYEDAAALLDVLIARYPEKPEFWLLQAHTFLGLKQPLAAAGNLEVIDRLGKATADSAFTLGDIYLTENLPDLAMRAYNRGIEIDDKQSPGRALRSAEALLARGATSQASAVTEHLQAAFGARLEDADKRKLLKLQARLSLASGADSSESVAVLLEVISLDPLDGEALLLLGKHYARHNEPDRAIFYYERAAGLEACEAEAKVRHAQVLAGLSRYGEAIPLLRRSLQLKQREDIARYLEQIERLAKSQK
jgi:tetratricopeptide (TPR) repeat protein